MRTILTLGLTLLTGMAVTAQTEIRLYVFTAASPFAGTFLTIPSRY